MEEDDDKIRQLFADFNPHLTSDSAFIDRLNKAMDSVEMIRQRSAEQRRRNRRAVVIAAVAGFAAGAVTSAVMPFVDTFVAEIFDWMPDILPIENTVDLSALKIAGWLVTGVVAVLTALAAFDRAVDFRPVTGK